MLTDAHMGEGGVKNCSNHAHVVYGRSLSINLSQLETFENPVLLCTLNVQTPCT